MGNFHIAIGVSNLQGTRIEEADVLVDTEATLTKIPRQLLFDLGYHPRISYAFRSPTARCYGVTLGT